MAITYPNGSTSPAETAIALGGGGPAAGLHIGVLEALADAGIKFDVWALSCIGAWVGIVDNQSATPLKTKTRPNRHINFSRMAFFETTKSYKRFPINTVFGPDWRSNIQALNNFVTNPDNYKDFPMGPVQNNGCLPGLLELLFNQLPDRLRKRKSSKNWMRETSTDGYSTKRWRPIPLSAFHVHDVPVQYRRPVQDQLSAQRIYEGNKVRGTEEKKKTTHPSQRLKS